MRALTVRGSVRGPTRPGGTAAPWLSRWSLGRSRVSSEDAGAVATPRQLAGLLTPRAVLPRQVPACLGSGGRERGCRAPGLTWGGREPSVLAHVLYPAGSLSEALWNHENSTLGT